MHELREAFREAARRTYADVPEEWELDYRFSRRFERKMRRMIRAQAHGYWHLVNTAAKRAAILAAVLLLLLCSVMALRPVRERVFRFFMEICEDSLEIQFCEQEENLDGAPAPMVRYTLTALPEGYEEVRFVQYEHTLWTHWEDHNGNSISLKQEVGTQRVTVNADIPIRSDININGQNIDCFQSEDGMTCIWEHDGYVFYFSAYSGFPQEQVVVLIESMEIYE